MTSATLFGAALVAVVAAFLVSLAGIAWRTGKSAKASVALLAAGAAALTAGMVMRWVEAGHAPWSNLYESLVLFSWAAVVFFLVFARREEFRRMTFLVAPLPLLALGAASLLPAESQMSGPLVPVLRSKWLIVHVMTVVLSYGAFALAFAAGLAQLAKTRGDGAPRTGLLAAALPSGEWLDEAGYRLVAVGFPLLTLGIVTGSAWAHISWGSYWSWDPKETWSLITWFVYAGVLHLRLVAGWKGRRSAYGMVLGFLVVVFTYVGVSYLLPGLHSYASGGR